MNEYNLLIGMIAFVIGFAIALWVKGIIVAQKVKAAEKETSRILEDAKRRSETLIKEAQLEVKDKLFKMKSDFDADTKETKHELKEKEQRLIQKEENIDRKIEQLEQREIRISKKEEGIDNIEKSLRQKEQESERLILEQRKQLERLAGISREQAKSLLIASMESEAKHDAAKMMRKIENEARDDADRKAQEILSLAVKRYAGDYVAEKTVSVVNLPNEEMKG